MRRSLSSRVFAALFAPWFAFVVAEPVPLHDCPVHSLHAAAPAATMPAMMGHEGMNHAAMDHAAMDHMDHAAPADGHQAPGHAGHHGCCCLGASCASVAVALASTPQPLAWLPIEILIDAWSPPAAAFVPASADHTLPFANGPPAGRV